MIKALAKSKPKAEQPAAVMNTAALMARRGQPWVSTGCSPAHGWLGLGCSLPCASSGTHLSSGECSGKPVRCMVPIESRCFTNTFFDAAHNELDCCQNQEDDSPLHPKGMLVSSDANSIRAQPCCVVLGGCSLHQWRNIAALNSMSRFPVPQGCCTAVSHLQ